MVGGASPPPVTISRVLDAWSKYIPISTGLLIMERHKLHLHVMGMERNLSPWAAGQGMKGSVAQSDSEGEGGGVAGQPHALGCGQGQPIHFHVMR